ncbi:helix-turn-helix domain-containing protein [Sinomonas susongensis]|uniref:helix-turn-helix domain-containing protein n=1 Tax=Sinomonas susongensis TaxID=1324851 RepID=UPI001107C810|nr:helix-turn-helix transcriptional regulator [Sinomonas susongensis]
MGVNFGAHLRAQRIARGLTQAEVGGHAYSPSYISLLEIGRREPTAKVIEEIASRLGTAAEVLESWDYGTEPEDVGWVLASLAARQAWDMRDYAQASHQARTAAENAWAAGRYGSWWDATYLQIESLAGLGEFAQARAIAEDLLCHPLAASSDALAVRTRQFLSAVCLGLGELVPALAHAREAVQAAAVLPVGSTLRIAALRSLVAALAESGCLDEAWEHCLVLGEQISEETPGQIAGEAEWVIGNVAFLRGDGEQGTRAHEHAAALLSPANDLLLWARFNKASAATRLSGGIIEPATLAALERAEIAYSIVGGRRAEQLELALVRARWLHLNAQHAEAAAQLEQIRSESHLLGHHTAAEAALLLGRALTAVGRPDRARALYHEARAGFLRAGLPEMALAAEHAAAGLLSRRRRALATASPAQP